MSNFVVVVFADESKAYEGVRALHELHAEASLTLYSNAVVRRAAGGRLVVKKEQPEGPIGMALGALLGGLAGLFAGALGALGGSGPGSPIGALRYLLSIGVSEDFFAVVAGELQPGRTALIAEIAEESLTPLDSRMQALGGVVVREKRLDLVDQQIEKGIAHYKVELARRRDERAAAKAENLAASVQKVMRAQEKLRAVSARARTRVDYYRRESDAKIATLRAQADGAAPAARSRIEERIAGIRADQEQRIGKLEQAYR